MNLLPSRPPSTSRLFSPHQGPPPPLPPTSLPKAPKGRLIYDAYAMRGPSPLREVINLRSEGVGLGGEEEEDRVEVGGEGRKRKEPSSPLLDAAASQEKRPRLETDTGQNLEVSLADTAMEPTPSPPEPSTDPSPIPLTSPTPDQPVDTGCQSENAAAAAVEGAGDDAVDPLGEAQTEGEVVGTATTTAEVAAAAEAAAAFKRRKFARDKEYRTEQNELRLETTKLKTESGLLRQKLKERGVVLEENFGRTGVMERITRRGTGTERVGIKVEADQDTAQDGTVERADVDMEHTAAVKRRSFSRVQFEALEAALEVAHLKARLVEEEAVQAEGARSPAEVEEDDTRALQAEIERLTTLMEQKTEQIKAKDAEMAMKEAEVTTKLKGLEQREKDLRSQAEKLKLRADAIEAREMKVKANIADCQCREADIVAKGQQVKAREEEIQAERADLQAIKAKMRLEAERIVPREDALLSRMSPISEFGGKETDLTTGEEVIRAGKEQLEAKGAKRMTEQELGTGCVELANGGSAVEVLERNLERCCRTLYEQMQGKEEAQRKLRLVERQLAESQKENRQLRADSDKRVATSLTSSTKFRKAYGSMVSKFVGGDDDRVMRLAVGFDSLHMTMVSETLEYNTLQRAHEVLAGQLTACREERDRLKSQLKDLSGVASIAEEIRAGVEYETLHTADERLASGAREAQKERDAHSTKAMIAQPADSRKITCTTTDAPAEEGDCVLSVGL